MERQRLLVHNISLPAATTVPRAIYDLPEDGTFSVASCIRWGRCCENLECESRSHLYLPGPAKPRGERGKQGLACSGIRNGRGPEQADRVRPVAFVGVMRHVEELSERLQLGFFTGAERLQNPLDSEV